VRPRTNAANWLKVRENALFLVFKLVLRLSLNWRGIMGAPHTRTGEGDRETGRLPRSLGEHQAERLEFGLDLHTAILTNGADPVVGSSGSVGWRVR